LDFIELVEKKFMRIIDVNKTNKIEIIFIEKIDTKWNFIVHSKNKCIIDILNKELLIFVIENPEQQ
jgi:hypothetical protein